MSLPSEFQFSQTSLQDFETCPRRFELRYLRQLSWPAIESEPVQEAERLAQLGVDFHRLVHQHLVGLDEAVLTDSLPADQPELKLWWQSYLNHRPAILRGADTWPELTLSTPLRGYRLLARFDLLAVTPDGDFVIVDWKTARRKPAREALARRLQSRVYPYVLARAGAAYNHGQPIDPARIRLIYWYPVAPQQPEQFDYSPQLMQRDEQYLSELVERIKHAAQQADFPVTAEVEPCRYCIYRSFCDRGDQAGPLLEVAEESPAALDVTALDWDQIAEIQF